MLPKATQKLLRQEVKIGQQDDARRLRSGTDCGGSDLGGCTEDRLPSLVLLLANLAAVAARN